jgi:hypothetical protein
MNYATEVEFLRAEVEKCHASMHSQIETINLLMKRNIELKQKRQWVGIEKEDMPDGDNPMFDHEYFIKGMVYASRKLEDKNT